MMCLALLLLSPGVTRVTQTDKDNEEAIVGLITGAFPDHIFIGEVLRCTWPQDDVFA